MRVLNLAPILFDELFMINAIQHKDRFFKLLGKLVFTSSLVMMVTMQNLGAATVVPAGNRNEVQPPIPGASARRTRELATTYDAKFNKVFSFIKNDARLRKRIEATAKAYGISPVHIAGAIIGEHTYNVDVYDRIQTYYVKGMSWAKQGVSFSYQGEKIGAFIARPQFETCKQFTDSYRLWSCREKVWNEKFSGKTVDGKSFPKNRFSAVFFQPFYAGQTFGLGQVNPLTALKVSDRVHQISGLPKLEAENGDGVYRAIMDPDLTLPYIAATIRQSIDSYRQIADMDISKNPGLTSTLYNTGGADERARALASLNKQLKSENKPIKYPEENYYGWFVNTKAKELESLF